MIKQVQFRGQDDEGNVFCLPLVGDNPCAGLEKTAQYKPDNLHPAVRKFVQNVKSTPEGAYILVNALGAGEYWGSNVNGDYFPEKALIHAPPGWDDMTPEQMREASKNWEYGFPTFMNAYPYKHHVNKDPSRAFGQVIIAVWNPKMHRVELVVYIDRALCKRWGAEDVIDRIDQGEFPDVSMGCKVPDDICMICGHRSKTRKDYCDHARLMMNKILPDGRKVAVRNDKPRFFDISFVFIGADKSAKMLAKLAQVGDMQCLGGYCVVPRSSAAVGEAFSSVEEQARDLAEYWSMQKVAEAKLANDPIKLCKEVDGIWVAVEWKKGETRKYRNKKGEVTFSQKMKADYGYVPGTKDSDGEEVDVYVGPQLADHTWGFLVTQKKPDGKFDEHKLMIGYASEEAAKASYLDHMPENRFGGIREVELSNLQKVLDEKGKIVKSKLNACDESKFAAAFGQKSASHAKLSEIIKSVPAGPFRKAMLPKLEKMEGRLPKQTLRKMAEYDLSTSLSTAACMGIVLKPQEFQHLVLTKVGQEESADWLDDNKWVFAESDDVNENVEICPECGDEGLKQELMPFMAGRSIAEPLLEKRASVISSGQWHVDVPSRIKEPEALDQLSAMYNGYRRTLIKKAEVLENALASDPHLLPLIAGGSLAQAFAGGIEKTASANVFGPRALAYLHGAHYREDHEWKREVLGEWVPSDA